MIDGEKGTGKTTIVTALVNILDRVHQFKPASKTNFPFDCFDAQLHKAVFANDLRTGDADNVQTWLEMFENVNTAIERKGRVRSDSGAVDKLCCCTANYLTTTKAWRQEDIHAFLDRFHTRLTLSRPLSDDMIGRANANCAKVTCRKCSAIFVYRMCREVPTNSHSVAPECAKSESLPIPKPLLFTMPGQTTNIFKKNEAQINPFKLPA